MYGYQDLDPAAGSGSDIVHHTDHPVDPSGWTQSVLSAEPETADCVGRPYAYALPRSAVPRGELDDPHHDYAAIDIQVPLGIVGHVGGGFGNGVTLTDADGVTYIYGHLDDRAVGAGTTVTPGRYLGESGNTGQPPGPHLHFEIRVGGVKHCPQRLLLALYDNTTSPALGSLPTTGCCY